MFGGHSLNCLSTGSWIHPTGVGNHSNVAINQRRQYPINHRDKVTGIPGFGITGALFLHNRHGDFGQIIENQVVNRAAFNLTKWGFQPVTPKSLPTSNADCFHDSIKVLLHREWFVRFPENPDIYE